MEQMAVDRARGSRAALVVCVLALVAGGPVAAARAGAGASDAAPAPGDYSVTLEQCVSSGVQAERSVTFVSQMFATATTQKMAMKIVLEERARGEAEYHAVPGPGFGVWRSSEPGVKIYKYVKQVTSLAAPASYRIDVKFRWVAGKGKVIKHAEQRSSRCFQSPLTAPVTPAPASS
jgi:hypothetical protein